MRFFEQPECKMRACDQQLESLLASLPTRILERPHQPDGAPAAAAKKAKKPRKPKKARRADSFMVSDGLYHEIGSVADIGGCSKEDRPDADCQQVWVKSVIAEQQAEVDFARWDEAGLRLDQQSECGAQEGQIRGCIIQDT